MLDKKVADLLDFTSRFMRSVHLERDFYDPRALAHYVPTEFVQSCFARIVSGLKPGSGQRAWRLTGDYGSGKSSFALLLAHSFAGDRLPGGLSASLDFRRYGVACPRFLPVLLTCSRRPLHESILDGLQVALRSIYPRAGGSRLMQDIDALARIKSEPKEEDIISLVQRINEKLISEGRAKGLILIVDELGKFLEFAAHNVHRQDIFLLQRLAETAVRSGETPLFMICVLHQGFNVYADVLDPSSQREWEKIAGRFEEIVFNQPAEQIAQVVASALNVRTRGIPAFQDGALRHSMKEAVVLGWFGGAKPDRLAAIAPRLFPIHPMVLPVLLRFFKRFGQNERSLFSFLFSTEPFGLRAFSEAALSESDLYRIHNLYDYVRTCFGHRLTVLGYRSHWNTIEAVIDTFSTGHETHLRILKTIGMLNLLNDSDLLPSEEAVVCSLADSRTPLAKHIKSALEELRRGKRVLYDRGRSRGMCLWPHTSVDLEKALEDARRAISPTLSVSSAVMEYLDPRPIVARRHYIETGNLRYFDVYYCSVHDFAQLPPESPKSDADGVIVVPLCENVRERTEAIATAQSAAMREKTTWLVAIPEPLLSLSHLLRDVQRWDWVSINTLELNADRYAREEVSRQKETARSQLQRTLRDLVGLREQEADMLLEWYHCGERITVNDGRELHEYLSQVFDKTFCAAPRVANELVNRRFLSSAAAAARMRLLERMITHRAEPLLGMDAAKKPPEMSMYLSVLEATGIHRPEDGSWVIAEPRPKSDTCHLLPVLRRTYELVRAKGDQRIGVAALLEELRRPPYGVREGLAPILLMVATLAHERDVAFYKDGTFLGEMSSESILLLTKAPERFELQYCRVAGVRAEVYEMLATALELGDEERGPIELLDVVKPLCMLVANLPDYVRNTRKLSSEGIAVRDAILAAREPIRLLYSDLPSACGFAPVPGGRVLGKGITAFIKSFKASINELRVAYPRLLDRVRAELVGAFEYSGPVEQCRRELGDRCRQVIVGVSEPKLKAFCLRVADGALSEPEWLESVGSYVALVPPKKWHDRDEAVFSQQLTQYALHFRRVESIVFGDKSSGRAGTAVRLAVTLANGEEHDKVVYTNPDDEARITALQQEFMHFLNAEPTIALAAVSRALWRALDRSGNGTK